MSTMVKKNAKGLAVVLSAAMVFSATAMPASDAKAKKPKLSTTKVSIEQGAKKKVTVKNAKKVTWKLTKAAKKVVSLSKKSKKGATIKGKAVGKAKITVKMKYGKKTLTKKITVSVTKKTDTTTNTNKSTPTPPADTNKATPTPTVTPTPTPSEPTAEPTATPKPGYKKLQVDLSTAVDVAGEKNTGDPKEGDTGIFYNADTGILKVLDTSIFRVDLPETLPEGSVMDVTVKGTLNGEKGFRAYFINNNEDVNISPDIAVSDDDNVPLGEPFEWNFTLEVNEDCEATQLQFKGITYADNIDDLTISSIVMEYKNAADAGAQ